MFEMTLFSSLTAFNVQVVIEATSKYGQVPAGSPPRTARPRRQVTAELAQHRSDEATTGGPIDLCFFVGQTIVSTVYLLLCCFL